LGWTPAERDYAINYFLNNRMPTHGNRPTRELINTFTDDEIYTYMRNGALYPFPTKPTPLWNATDRTRAINQIVIICPGTTTSSLASLTNEQLYTKLSLFLCTSAPPTLTVDTTHPPTITVTLANYDTAGDTFTLFSTGAEADTALDRNILLATLKLGYIFPGTRPNLYYSGYYFVNSTNTISLIVPPFTTPP
jgi:hypothetical protein